MTDSDIDRPSEARLAAAMLGAALGIIHLASAPAHVGAHLIVAGWFAAIGVLALAWSWRVLRAPTATLLATGASGAAVLAALWMTSRTVGLPFGIAPVQPVGLLDGLAAIDEVMIMLLVVLLARGRVTRRSAVPMLGGTSYAAISLAAVSLSVLAGGPHAHGHAQDRVAERHSPSFYCRLF